MGIWLIMGWANESKCEAHFMNEQMYKKNELLRKKNLSASNEKNAGGRGLEILSVWILTKRPEFINKLYIL